jgi:hypothetical protein
MRERHDEPDLDVNPRWGVHPKAAGATTYSRLNTEKVPFHFSGKSKVGNRGLVLLASLLSARVIRWHPSQSTINTTKGDKLP